MKRLDTFLTEKEKEKNSPGPKPIEDGKGADDELYIKLMVEYKTKRVKDPENSRKVLDKAEKLIQDGDVSTDAILSAAYL